MSSILRQSVLLFLSFFVFISAFGQESATNQTNPPSLKWYQINTANFRILYPLGFDQQAQRMANTLEHIREPEAASMGVKPKKISVLLQNQSSISNGFVTLAPRRSEFFTMPAQDYNFAGTNDWLNLLASHEYRHIVQFQQSITGFNKLVYYVFGQTAVAGMAFVAVPQWFWEGDAVATETAFTHSGRGRIPNFDLLFRTNLLERKTFNYHKQYLRSYKHNIPNHYVLGYHMVSYLRKKTGDAEIWNRIVKRAWSVPFIPFTFSRAIKKETGLHVVDLYKEMAADLKNKWTSELDSLEFTPFEKVNPRSTSAYTDYQYPQPLEDGSVVAVKSGIGDIERLVVLNDGREKSKFVQGPVNDAGLLSSGNMKVVWNEYRYDPRWQVKSYSMIVAYDFSSGKKKIISKHSRYSSAALSPDGSKVATVESGTDYKIKLVVLDYVSGKVLKEFNNPDNQFISMPRWSSDGKSIVALRLTPSGKTVVKYDYESGALVVLINASQENVGHPVLYEKYLFYNSPYSGIDNIYVLNLETGKKFQVTSSKHGSYNPSVSSDGKTLYYSEQTKNGMDVVKAEFDPYYWKPLNGVARTGEGYFQHLVDQEGRPNILDSVPQNVFPKTKYNKLKGMVNVHSWGPYTNSSLSYLDLGVSSKDLLGTTTLDLGYRYDATERTGFWKANASYQGFYPIFDFNYSQGKRSVDEGDLIYKVKNGLDTTQVTKNLTFEWKEQKVETGLRIPLRLTQSKYHTQINFGNFIGVTKVSEFKNSIDGGGRIITTNYPQYIFRNYAGNGTLLSNYFSFTAWHALKTSRRDIYSKWAQYVAIESYSTPFGGDFQGSLFSVYGRLFFPGFVKHHSFNGYWGYQNTLIAQANITTRAGLDNYIFRNQIPSPRGQSVSRFQDYYAMSANYTFPIWYPDIALGPILNIQRVSGNLFTDYAFGQSKTFKTSQAYTSFGGELKFDVNILRFLPQLNFGVRYSYSVEKQSGGVEFLIGNIPF